MGTAYILQKVLSITYSKTITEKPSTGQAYGLNLTLGEQMLHHELNNYKIMMMIVKIAILIIIMVMIIKIIHLIIWQTQSSANP